MAPVLVGTSLPRTIHSGSGRQREMETAWNQRFFLAPGRFRFFLFVSSFRSVFISGCLSAGGMAGSRIQFLKARSTAVSQAARWAQMAVLQDGWGTGEQLIQAESAS